jgi:hypothetical protein
MTDYLRVPGLPASSTPANRAQSKDLGPCLYLGPLGQRCTKSALEGGFCALHSPHSSAAITPNRRRALAALAAIVGILWPYVDDVVREIIRWMHSH